jgi:hypothetical protein
MVMRDLFTPDPAPMLPLEFPQVELEGRIRRLRSPRYVDYDTGNAILGRLAWLGSRRLRMQCPSILGPGNVDRLNHLAPTFHRGPK